MPLCLITGNQGKLAGARLVFPDIKVLDIDLPEIQSLSAREIIEYKLQEGLKHHSVDGLVVEDTSVYIEALNNLPGPLIKWFLEALGNDGLADMVMKYENHNLKVVSIVGYAKSPSDIHFFEGSVVGTIVRPRGSNGFGWNPIFQPKGHTKTFAEMDDTERYGLSMRTEAFKKLKQFLS
jgi:inosine triphosphate pyrophosphatase